MCSIYNSDIKKLNLFILLLSKTATASYSGQYNIKNIQIIKNIKMSSRRDLKKLINNSLGLLYNDCIFYKVFTHSPNIQKADEIILKIADAHTDLINRLSVSEGKEIKSRTVDSS